MSVTLAQPNSKFVVDGVDQAIKGLQQVAQAFDQAGQSAGKTKQPVDGIVAALSKFGVFKEAATQLFHLGEATIENYAETQRLGMSLQSLIAKDQGQPGGISSP